MDDRGRPSVVELACITGAWSLGLAYYAHKRGLILSLYIGG